MTNAESLDRLAPTRRPDNQRVVMRQTWERLLFLHWPVEPEAIQALLPPGLTVDTFEGRAYVGLVPFLMRNVRPVWSPPVSGLSHFPEVNVRTYVHQGGSAPGVWFFSLDAENSLAVALARTLFKLPYYHARFDVRREGDAMQYASRRRGGAGCRVRYAPLGSAAPAGPETLEYFLTERYLLYAYDGANLFRGQVHHMPYPLQRAGAEIAENTLVAASGVRLPTGAETNPPLAHYAANVEVEVFPLMRAIKPISSVGFAACFLPPTPINGGRGQETD